MQSATPARYSHPRLIRVIQQPPPEHHAAVRAVYNAQALVQEKQLAFIQAEQQLAQAEEHLMQPGRTQLQAVERACRCDELVRELQQALNQTEKRLAQAQARAQQKSPAQQDYCQLVRQLQTAQHACWNRSLSAELSGLILGKTSRHHVKMVSVSCPMLRDTTNAAEPITFEVSPLSQTRIAASDYHTLCVSASGRVLAWGNNIKGQLGIGHTRSRAVPTLVGLPKSKTVVQVSAGRYHTVV